MPEWVRGGGMRRALAYGVVGVGLITTLTAMAALHPHQQVYFNALVDTKTPGALAERYDMDYWNVAHRQSLERLLARYPDDTLRVWVRSRNWLILPQNDRERIVGSPLHEAEFHISRPANQRNRAHEAAFHSIEAYGSAIALTLDAGSDAYLDYYRAEYGDVEANGTLMARSEFDIYIHDGALRYLKEDCEPLLANFNGDFKIFLHIVPADPAELPAHRREHGFENLDFRLAVYEDFLAYTAFFDGKCIIWQPLPNYRIARISTGQHFKGEVRWRADIHVAAHAAARALYDSIAAGDYGKPVAQSDFDVYLRDGGLAYLKENCDQGDVDARFFLHIFPADAADLPADGREHGFANLDFQFADRGARAGDACVADRELPGYAIERIRTGQFVSGDGQLWSAEFAAGR